MSALTIEHWSAVAKSEQINHAFGSWSSPALPLIPLDTLQGEDLGRRCRSYRHQPV
jgi:hypothetical protein